MTVVSLLVRHSEPASDPYAGLLEGLLEAVWLIDGQTRRILAINSAALQLQGLSTEQLVGQPVEAMVSTPEDAMFWAEAAANREASLNA